MTITTKTAATIFKALVEKLGRDDLNTILADWNDSELSDDGTKIVIQIGRDREYSRGSEGGEASVSKKEFLNWLDSDGPFDEKVYGENIKSDHEWCTKITTAKVLLTEMAASKRNHSCLN